MRPRSVAHASYRCGAPVAATMPRHPTRAPSSVHPLLTIAIRAAREAGKVIVREMDRVDALDVTTKGLNDYVSEVDRRAERAIIATVRRSYPDHAILGEETGADGVDDHVWVIDPLDGTTNYLHGFPVFSVSIAIKYRGKVEHGVVYDPLRNELFTATRGRGAQLNNHRVRVSRRTGLEGALLGTGFPFRDMKDLDAYLAIFRELLTKTAGIRRPGSAALDLAYVACGRLDGFWEYGLKEWDMAAGTLLIQEAGGAVSDFEGGEAYLTTGNVVGGGLRVQAAILEVIGRLGSRGARNQSVAEPPPVALAETVAESAPAETEAEPAAQPPHRTWTADATTPESAPTPARPPRPKISRKLPHSDPTDKPGPRGAGEASTKSRAVPRKPRHAT